jgi:hypothetical protein
MKQAAVQSSAPGSAAVNSSLNDNGSMVSAISEWEPEKAGGPAVLDQRRERTRDHLAKIAARRKSWINRNRYHYELLIALGVTCRCQEHGVQVKACAHAVTACYLQAQPKKTFEFLYQRLDFGGRFGNEESNTVSLLSVWPGAEEKLRKRWSRMRVTIFGTLAN